MSRFRRSIKEPEPKPNLEPPAKREFTPLQKSIAIAATGLALFFSVLFVNNVLVEETFPELNDSYATDAFEGFPSFSFLVKDTPPNTDPRVDWVDVKTPDGDYTGIEKLCDESTLIYRDKSFGKETPISTESDSPECLPLLTNRK